MMKMKTNPSNMKLLKWAVVRIDSTLKCLQINSLITWTPSTSTGNVPSLSPQSGLLLHGTTATLNVEIRAKLPKLEMKRFNGRPKEWQVFIDCFDSAVHSNPKLSNIDKMNYLKSLVEGPAAAAVKGLLLTSENYSARKILEERYGNKQLIISSHMDNLSCQWSVLSTMLRGSDYYMKKQKSTSEPCKLWA